MSEGRLTSSYLSMDQEAQLASSEQFLMPHQSNQVYLKNSKLALYIFLVYVQILEKAYFEASIGTSRTEESVLISEVS